jgi:hypothetical protein
MTGKPSLVEVVGQRVELRRVGHQWRGLCPFHAEKTPSFFVDEEKQVFYCHGCHEGGDVISFIMKLDGLTFSEACRSLGIEGNGKRPAPRISPNRCAAVLLAGWLNHEYLLLGVRLRELSQEIAIGQQIPNSKFVESLTGEWEILADIHEDLQKPQHAEEFWLARDFIEELTADVEQEPLDEFPPMTEVYRNYLGGVVAC